MAQDIGTIITGAARSDQINSGGLPIDMEAQTALLNPSLYPFEALTRSGAGGGKEAVDQMKHEYRERRLVPNYVKLTAAATAGASTLTVDHYTYIHDDRYLYIPSTNEMVLVQDTAIDSTVSIVRSTGSGTLINAIANGAVVIILPEAHAEGEEVPSAYTNDSISRYNYVMQSDRRISATDIEEAIKHYDSTEKMDADRKAAMIEYKRDQNLLGYVGQSTREIVSASGPRRHCCSGLIELLTENSIDLSGTGGTITLQTLANAMSLCIGTNGGSADRTGMFGVNAWRQISAWPEQYLRETSGSDKTWGIKLNKIITGFGDLKCVYDPVLSDNIGLADRFFILDLPFIKQLFLRTKPVQLYTDIPNLSTLHTKVDAVSGTFGWQVKFPELHVHGQGVK